MRIAWFRPVTPDAADPLDDGAALIDELRRSHSLDVILEGQAHDFVWRHFLDPWDLVVYELDHSGSSEFIVAYALNYPGVLMLRSANIAHVHVPITASRIVVTPTAEMADMLRARVPAARFRVATPAVTSRPQQRRRSTDGRVHVAVLENRHEARTIVRRALKRARDAGAVFETLDARSDVATLSECDIVISTAWPPFAGTATAVLAGMAAGKAVITTETETTAAWSALDPQTWRARGVAVTEAPVAVTVDPRDEEHSLMLAIRRLSSDATLRDQLGRAAHHWWQSHATPAHAASAWAEILAEAPRVAPPPRPDNWPKQFIDDGTGLTRGILRELGLPPMDIPARS